MGQKVREYIISFDLLDASPEQYIAFFDTLNTIGAKKILSNGAFLATNSYSAYELLKVLNPKLRGFNDRLLIIEVVTTECASSQLLHPICKEKHA